MNRSDAAKVELEDKILTGPPTSAADLIIKLERRMGSMKLVGERDDLLLDSAVCIQRLATTNSELLEGLQMALLKLAAANRDKPPLEVARDQELDFIRSVIRKAVQHAQ
jgi:hypothetical protein